MLDKEILDLKKELYKNYGMKYSNIDDYYQ